MNFNSLPLRPNCALLGILLTLLFSHARGAIWYVDAATAAPLNTQNGQSWSTAYADLQTALAASAPGDTIWIADGTYYPVLPVNPASPSAAERATSFPLKTSMQIYGGFVGGESALADRPTPLAQTILSGDIGRDDINAADGFSDLDIGVVGKNSNHVVSIISADNCLIDGCLIVEGGDFTSPNRIEGHGGGLFIEESTGSTLQDCTFIANATYSGGGIRASRADLTLHSCHFKRNRAASQGGAILINNFVNEGRPSFNSFHCTFSENTSGNTGGAIYFTYSTLGLFNCRFDSNNSKNGGAITSYRSPLAMANCLFAKNTVNNYGGAVYESYHGTNTIKASNCTFAENTAGIDGHHVRTEGNGSHSIHNTIFWDGDTPPASGDAFSSLIVPVSYSSTLIQGVNLTGAGLGNLDGTDPESAPLFTDPSTSDYELGLFSGAINKGLTHHSLSVNLDPLDQDGDSDLREVFPLDLANQPRHSGSLIDLGCYEYQSPIETPNPIYLFEQSGINHQYIDLSAHLGIDISSIDVSSSDPGVATASEFNGVISITTIAPGNATLTITLHLPSGDTRIYTPEVRIAAPSGQLLAHYPLDGTAIDAQGDFDAIATSPIWSPTDLTLDEEGDLSLPLWLSNNILAAEDSLEVNFRFRIDSAEENGVTSLFSIKQNHSTNVRNPGIMLSYSEANVETGETLLRLSYSDGTNDAQFSSLVVATCALDTWYDLSLIFDFNRDRWLVKTGEQISGGPINNHDDFTYNLDTLRSFLQVTPVSFGHFDQHGTTAPELTSSVTLDEIKIYSPFQATATSIKSSLEALTHHLTGIASLTDEEQQTHFTNIEVGFLFAEYSEIQSAVESFIQTFETERGAVFPGSNTLDPTTLDWTTQALISVQQFIHTYHFLTDDFPLVSGLAYADGKVFPGEVPQAAPRVPSATVNIDGDYHQDPNAIFVMDDTVIRPLGYYLSAGETVTIKVDPAYTNLGLQVVVGSHFRDLLKDVKTSVNRFRDIAIEYPLDETSVPVANPFGGGLYIRIPAGTSSGEIPVTIEGAVKSAYYSARAGKETDPATWLAEVALSQAPWVDFESDKFMTTIPLSFAQTVSAPALMMAKWDEIMDQYRYMNGRPYARYRAEWYQLDRQMPYPSFGAGYPTVISLSNASSATGNWDPTKVLTVPPHRTLFHELGHNCAIPGPASNPITRTLSSGEVVSFNSWAEGESLVNLPAAVIYNRVYGDTLDDAFSKATFQPLTINQAALDWMFSENFINNEPIGFDTSGVYEFNGNVMDELRYQARGIGRYGEIARAFGWEALNQIQSEFYPVRSEDQIPNGKAHRLLRDALIRRASEKMGINMAPLLHFWGVQPSDELKAELATMPKSLQIKELLDDYWDLAPKNRAEFDLIHAELYPHVGSHSQLRYDHLDTTFTDTEVQAMAAQIDLIRNEYGLVSGDEPTHLMVEMDATGLLMFNWRDASSGEVSFVIRTKEDHELTFTEIGRAPANATHLFSTALLAPATRTISIAAIYADGSESLPTEINLNSIPVAPVIDTANAWLHYSFDTDFTDSSANGNDGTPVDDSDGTLPFIDTSASAFGGGSMASSEKLDYVEIPTPFTPLDGAPWTITFFADLVGNAESYGFELGTQHRVHLRNDAVKAVQLKIAGQATWQFDAPDLEIDSELNHVAIVANPSGIDLDNVPGDDRFAVYLNGTLLSPLDAIDITSPTVSTAVVFEHIGAAGFTPSGSVGNIDEVWVFEQALSPGQVNILRTRNTFEKVWHVNENSPAALADQDGLSWSSAFADLQDALTAANNADQIWIAGGIYTPAAAGNPDESFIISSGLQLCGSYVGDPAGLPGTRDTLNQVSILSGDLAGDDITEQGVITGDPASSISGSNSRHVVSISSSSDTPELHHLTVTGGFTDTVTPLGGGSGIHCEGNAIIDSCRVIGNFNIVNEFGTGIHATNGTVTITDSEIRNNMTISNHAGLYVSAATVTVKDSFLEENKALNGGGFGLGSGQLRIENSFVRGNQASFNGGGGSASGGLLILTGSVISGNYAGVEGGGIWTDSGVVTTISNCTIAANFAGNNGGGIRLNTNLSGEVEFYNTLISQNEVTGGLQSNVHLVDGTVLCRSCIISGANFVSPGGGGSPALVQEGHSAGAFPAGLVDISQNSNGLPFFRSLTPGSEAPNLDGHYRLAPTSIGIDDGDNFAPNVDSPLDISGRTRRFDAGQGNGAAIDVGAYEFQYLSALQAWQEQYGLAEDDSENLVDFAGDGIPAIQKLAFNMGSPYESSARILDLQVPTSGGLPKFYRDDSGDLMISLICWDSYYGEIGYSVQGSSSLTDDSWQNLSAFPGLVLETTDEPIAETNYKIRHIRLDETQAAQIFLRVGISKEEAP